MDVLFAFGEERLGDCMDPEQGEWNSQGRHEAPQRDDQLSQCSDPTVGQKEYLASFLLPECLVWPWGGFSSSHAGKRHPSKPSWERQGEEASH